jgi:tetratricopeptide (TPR) repeat protein
MKKSWQYILSLLFLIPLSLFAQDKDKDKDREMEQLLQKNLTSIKVLEERLRQLDYQNRLQMESIRQQMNMAFNKDTSFYRNSLKLLQENMLRIDANYQAQLRELRDQKTSKQSALDSIFVMQEAKIKAKQMEQSTMFIYGGIILILINFILFLVLLHYFRSRQYKIAEEIKSKVQAETRAALSSYMQDDFKREIQKAFAQYAPQTASANTEASQQTAIELKAQEVLLQIDNKSAALLEKMAQLEQYLGQLTTAPTHTATTSPVEELAKQDVTEELATTEPLIENETTTPELLIEPAIEETAAPELEFFIENKVEITTPVSETKEEEVQKEEVFFEEVAPLTETAPVIDEKPEEEEVPEQVDEAIAQLFAFVKEEKDTQNLATEEEENTEEQVPEKIDIPFDFGNFFLNQETADKDAEEEGTHRTLDGAQIVTKTEKALSTILNQDSEEQVSEEESEEDLDEEEAIYWAQRGTIAYEKQDYEVAVDCFSKSLLLKEDFIAYTKRANSYHLLKKYEKAAADYEKAIKLNPDFVPAYNNAIEIHILTDNFFQALAVLEQLSKVNKPAHYKAVELYLKLIVQKALNQTSEKTERELDQVMRENFQFNYSFKQIEEWLATADIEPTNKRLIQVKMQLLKMKKAA